MPLAEQNVDLFPLNQALIKRLASKSGSISQTSSTVNFKSQGTSPLVTTAGLSMKRQSSGVLSPALRSSISRLSCSGHKSSFDNKPIFQIGECKEHGRKLELVCLDHQCRICTNCALFGAHKSHNFRTEEDVLKEITNRAETLLNLFEEIEQNQNQTIDQRNADKVSARFLKRFNEISDEVRDKFSVQCSSFRAFV